MSQTRCLAAILAADVAGYSRLMGADEEGTLERLKALRNEFVDPKIAEHKGRIVKTTGDGMLVEFASVVDAVRCAVAVQQTMLERNTGIPADHRIELRIGINLGDVIVEGDDLYGDGVNIAARIEALADPGGVLVSNTVHEHVRDRLPFVFDDLGEQQVKNIARPVRVFRVRDAGAVYKDASASTPRVLALPDKPSIAVLPFINMSGDPEQEYFADGMVEEILTALSRIRWLFVIARESSFTYKGQRIDVKQVGRELGVRYVLEGSVRKAGGRVRMCSTCRTRSRQVSRGSSSLPCKPPRQHVLRADQPPILLLTISICAPLRWVCRRRGKFRKRFAFWSWLSRSIRGTGQHSPMQRCAVFGWLLTVGAKTRRRTG
jgi:class 3 adenylate cyclase